MEEPCCWWRRDGDGVDTRSRVVVGRRTGAFGGFLGRAAWFPRGIQPLLPARRRTDGQTDRITDSRARRGPDHGLWGRLSPPCPMGTPVGPPGCTSHTDLCALPALSASLWPRGAPLAVFWGAPPGGGHPAKSPSLHHPASWCPFWGGQTLGGQHGGFGVPAGGAGRRTRGVWGEEGTRTPMGPLWDPIGPYRAWGWEG